MYTDSADVLSLLGLERLPFPAEVGDVFQRYEWDAGAEGGRGVVENIVPVTGGHPHPEGQWWVGACLRGRPTL